MGSQMYSNKSKENANVSYVFAAWTNWWFVRCLNFWSRLISKFENNLALKFVMFHTMQFLWNVFEPGVKSIWSLLKIRNANVIRVFNSTVILKHLVRNVVHLKTNIVSWGSFTVNYVLRDSTRTCYDSDCNRAQVFCICSVWMTPNSKQ